MACEGNNIQIVPVNVYWQMETQECIDFAGLTGLAAKGDHIVIYSAKDATKFALWGDDGVVADPVVSGATLLPFTIVGDSDTASTLATAAAAALDANAGFTASASGTVVSVKRTAIGETTDTTNGNMGVSVTVSKRGKDFDLGLLEGDVEFSVSPSNFIVQSHQSGVTPRAALFQGFETIEVSTTLQETSKSKLKEIYKMYGGSFTPMSGTEVFGGGTAKQGQNLLIDAARLVLKPVTATNNTDNTTLMMTIPIPDSLVFSGENPKTLSMTWQGFIDSSADTRVNAFMFGDQTQDGIYS